MTQPPVTIPIVLVHGILSGLVQRNVDCAPFLADAGIAQELLEEPAARVTASQYIALFRTLIDRLDDECLGLLSRPLKRGCFALTARSAMGAPNLTAAIRRIAHTFRLVQDDAVLEAVQEANLAGVALRFLDPNVPRPVFAHELLLRVYWRLLAWLAGGRLPAARFDFAFDRPLHADFYDKIFPAPLRFGQPFSAVWFDSRRLKDPVRRDAAALRTFLAESHAHVILPPRGRDSTSARVRLHLQQAEPTWPDLAATSAALHVSVSTLQRHLAAEGTSFQTLKDELRRDIAIVRLNTSRVPLAALAVELGFTDSAAFQRAFKGWTGSPPGAYRRGSDLADC